MSKEKTKEPEATFAGMQRSKLEAAASTMDALETKIATIRGELGNAVKDFEDRGGDKAAFKLARKIDAMEKTKRDDFWSNLNAYLDAFGTFAQQELFDPSKNPELIPNKMPIYVEPAKH